MNKVIAFFSSKGGVGKTCSCALLAHSMSEKGKKVLVIEMCQNTDIANNFGFDRFAFNGYTTLDWLTNEKEIEDVLVQVPDTTIEFIPATQQIDELEIWANRHMLRKQDEILLRKLEVVKDQYDFILIDCHPSQGSFVSIVGLIASDFVYIPVGTDGNALSGAYKAAEIVLRLKEDGLNLNYSIVPTRLYGNSFGKAQRVYKKHISQWVKEGITSYCSQSISDTRVIEDWTRQEMTYDQLKKHKTGKKVVKEFNNIADMFIGGVM